MYIVLYYFAYMFMLFFKWTYICVYYLHIQHKYDHNFGGLDPHPYPSPQSIARTPLEAMLCGPNFRWFPPGFPPVDWYPHQPRLFFPFHYLLFQLVYMVSNLLKIYRNWQFSCDENWGVTWQAAQLDRTAIYGFAPVLHGGSSCLALRCKRDAFHHAGGAGLIARPGLV